MRDWHKHASVRTRPRPQAIHDADGALFLVELAPHTSDARVAALGADAERALLAWALADYLDFTCALELDLINPVARALATDSMPVPIPPELRLDAHRVYCDEGYHALSAAELAADLGAPGREALPAPAIIARVAALVAACPGVDASLVRLAFAIVSETLVSETLRTLASDPRIAPAVRAFATDHARDEAWHATYFRRVKEVVWPTLAPSSRSALDALEPRLPEVFLAPDEARVARHLRAVGLEVG